MSVIGSAALLTTTFSLAQAQTETPPATPAAPTPATPVTPPPSAPTTTTSAPVAPSKPDKLATKLAKKLAKLTTAIGLTADQQPKVMAIYEDEEKQLAVAKTDKAKIKDAADAQIVALLTPEQNAKYTLYKKHKL